MAFPWTGIYGGNTSHLKGVIKYFPISGYDLQTRGQELFVLCAHLYYFMGGFILLLRLAGKRLGAAAALLRHRGSLGTEKSPLLGGSPPAAAWEQWGAGGVTLRWGWGGNSCPPHPLQQRDGRSCVPPPPAPRSETRGAAARVGRGGPRLLPPARPQPGARLPPRTRGVLRTRAGKRRITAKITSHPISCFLVGFFFSSPPALELCSEPRGFFLSFFFLKLLCIK